MADLTEIDLCLATEVGDKAGATAGMFNGGLEEGSVDAESAVLRDERLDLDAELDSGAAEGLCDAIDDAPTVVVSAWFGSEGDEFSDESTGGDGAVPGDEHSVEPMKADDAAGDAATGDETLVDEIPTADATANGTADEAPDDAVDTVDDTVATNGAAPPVDSISSDNGVSVNGLGDDGLSDSLEIGPEDLQRFDPPPLPNVTPGTAYGPHPDQYDHRYEEYVGQHSQQERYSGEFQGETVPEYRSTSDHEHREAGLGVHDLAPAESDLDVDEFLNSIGVDVEEPDSRRDSGKKSLEVSMSALSGVVAGAIGMALLIGLGAVIWQIASSRAREATVDEVTETSPVFDIGTLDLSHEVDEYREILGVLGLDDVDAELDGSVIRVTGMVETHEEFQSVISAGAALADGVVLDTSGLVVSEMATAGEVVPPTSEPAPVAPGGRPEALQRELDRIIAATPLIFGEASSDLTEIHLRVLNNVAAAMAGYPDLKIDVLGFTDSAGEPDGNQRLSRARAQRVIDQLASVGVDPERLVAVPQGEEKSSGADRLAGLERRVEFEVNG